jgi:hypothetical protein
MREYAVAFTFCVALGSMVALAGCGSSSPAPVPSTVAVPSPVPVQLSGVASDDEGAPVSGVTVLVYPFLNGPASLAARGETYFSHTDRRVRAPRDQATGKP